MGVDRPESIERFLPLLDEMVDEGMMTLEKAHNVAYRHGDASRLRSE